MENKLDFSTIDSVHKCIEEFTKEFLDNPEHYDSSTSFSFRYDDFRPKKDVVSRFKVLTDRKKYSKRSFKEYFLNK